jgi:hypothetical protein
MIMVLVIAGCIAFQAHLFPELALQGRTNPLTIAATVALWFGHAGWISLDRKRRGREVGPWRFLAIFFGPLAAWAYLLLEYRLKGFALIWLSLGVYVLAFGLGSAAALLILVLSGKAEISP